MSVMIICSLIVVVGFYQSTFIGHEQGEDHVVQVGFLSGSSSDNVTFEINLVLGTTGEWYIVTAQGQR